MTSHSTVEQRSQAGWIGVRAQGVIVSRTLSRITPGVEPRSAVLVHETCITCRAYLGMAGDLVTLKPSSHRRVFASS